MRTLTRSERDGRVLTVWIDNPPHNFLNRRIMAELTAIIRAADRDPGIGAVILTSALDGIFLTHYDVGEILEGAEAGPALPLAAADVSVVLARWLSRVPGARGVLSRSPLAGVLDLAAYHDLCRLMNRSSTVFIAAINGQSGGGGCELALACDLRLMADGPFTIGQPEMWVGLIPGGGGTQRLTRSLGQSAALELMLEGRALAPGEAVGAGLVHRVVDPADLLTEARETGRRLARRSPLSVRALKRAVYRGASQPVDRGLAREQAGFIATSASAAGRRAMRAYLQRVAAIEGAGGDLAPVAMEDWRTGEAVDLVS